MWKTPRPPRSASPAAPRIMARYAIYAIGLLFALGASLGAAAQDFYWESPRPLIDGSGRFPSLLQLEGGILAIWQESVTTNEGSDEAVGQVWLSMARNAGKGWEIQHRFAGPFAFRGTEPLLYSATGEGRKVAIATSAGDGRIEVLISTDGGASFKTAARPAPSSAAVAPRIFISAQGGYILFVTQGENESLSLSSSTSADGLSWKSFSPLIAPEDNLSLNFLPAAGRLQTKDGPRDIVVFQSLLVSNRPTFQLYSKLSADGGATWGKAFRLTTFSDPGQKEVGADGMDNERPYLAEAAGRLWLTWERRPLGGTTQIYATPLDEAGNAIVAQFDRVSTNSDKASCSAPQVLDIFGNPAVTWFDNRRGANRIYLALRSGIEWQESDLSRGQGDASFGRAALADNKAYEIWQSSSGGRDRILVLEPDTTVLPPNLAALDFSPGTRTRREIATIKVDMPQDSSGIAGYSYVWSQDASKRPPLSAMPMSPAAQRNVAEAASADGAWYLAVSALDYAGNWSEPARIRFDRDRTPPPPPIVLSADLDEGGFLASNSFALDWMVPDNADGTLVDDVAGYSWVLNYIGDLDRRTVALATTVSAKAPPARAELPGLSAYESALVSRAGPPLPPPTILGSKTQASYSNVDDGYYLFSVSAIDKTGNIGEASTILVRANKYIPYTYISYADSARDDFGKMSLRVLGKGFSVDGAIERLVLDRDGREPYDLDRLYAGGGFRIASDRQIDGVSFEDLEPGTYRIGLYHPKRGWYWTAPLVALDQSGTLKFGAASEPYMPSWRLLAPKTYRFSIYDGIVLVFVLFAGLGILLSSRQIVVATRDVAAIRLEVLALVSGGPMPTIAKTHATRKLKRRGVGLRLKITLIITSLVFFIVLMVALPLGYFMIQTESLSLGNALQQRSLVLLESVAQGARSYLPAENTLELGFLPQQAQALEEANYITVTGYGSDSSTDNDVVWATNDPDILAKIDTATFQAGVSRLKDSLSPQLAGIASDLNSRGAADVGSVNATLASLNQEGRSLATKLDAASQKRLAEISTTSRDLERDLTEKLIVLAKAAVGSTPAFDPMAAASKENPYLFYKPVLYRKGTDQLYYRGMVRLEVSSKKIVENVRSETTKLISRAAIIAALALALGVLGAIVLSTIIVVPISRLVKAIETIRDTEDKEKLEGMVIEVSSHDEIFTLADTVNQMTDGLAKAAKASKELIVGKGIQKMFIPLDPAPGTQAKLSTGHHTEKDFEFFGYYEGADAVSGDYWDFRSINSRYHYFIKCDVSGHGVSAALIMVQVATMVINYFNEWKQRMPAKIDMTEIAYRINDFLEERQFKGRFAAFTLGVWGLPEGPRLSLRGR